MSTDIMRLQSFAGANMSEVFRYLLDVSTNDDLDAGAVGVEYSTLGTPLRAEIVNGLLVRPQAGSLNLLVDPGVLFALSPDGAADDSNYKLVNDPGIDLLGALAMTTNPAGSIRIDVVEVRVTSVVPAGGTDSRDIFNPVTGLFAATSVTKVRQSTVTTVGAATNIRVRAGVAGGGFPGVVSGWLPIAVVSLPAATVNNDTMTFWDVRPLLNDRAFSVFASTRDAPLVTRSNFQCVSFVTTGVVEVTGTVDAVGRRLGGQLRRGSPGVDAASVDFSAAANQDPTLVLPAPGFVYAYLVTPFGLPRWARYTDGPAGRVPRSPRGIPILTNVAPTSFRGTPSAAITLPLATGLGGTTVNGVCFAPLWRDAVTGMNAIGDGHTITIGGDVFGIAGVIVVAGVNAVGKATFTIADGTTHPANAKALWVAVQMTITVAATTDQPLVLGVAATLPAGTVQPAAMPIYANVSNFTGAPIARSFRGVVRIPLTTGYPATTEAARTIIANIPGITPTASALAVLGWEIGP